MSTPARRKRVELTQADLFYLRRVEARHRAEEEREQRVAALVARVRTATRPQGLTQTW